MTRSGQKNSSAVWVTSNSWSLFESFGRWEKADFLLEHLVLRGDADADERSCTPLAT